MPDKTNPSFIIAKSLILGPHCDKIKEIDLRRNMPTLVNYKIC